MMKFGKPRNKTVRYFLGRVQNPEVRIQIEELTDYSWLTPEETRVRLTFPEARRILAEAIEKLYLN